MLAESGLGLVATAKLVNTQLSHASLLRELVSSLCYDIHGSGFRYQCSALIAI